MVYFDTLLLGITPLEEIQINEGVHLLRCVHPEKKSWLFPTIVETIIVHASEHIRRTTVFPFIYYISSEPYGASIRYNDSIVGVTPFYLSSSSNKNFVTISKEGYDDVILPLGGEARALHATLPSRLRGMLGETSPILTKEQSKSLIPIYITSGTAIVSGMAAAYFKIKADTHYDFYHQSGNPSDLDRVHQYDTISGIALVTSEASIILLSYLLFSR